MHIAMDRVVPCQLDVVHDLIEQLPSSLDVRDGGGCLPAHYAAMYADIATVRLALFGPFVRAVAVASVATADAIAVAASRAAAVDMDGRTPAHCALSRATPSVAVLALLFSLQPSRDVRDVSGRSVVDLLRPTFSDAVQQVVRGTAAGFQVCHGLCGLDCSR
jgi:ankyrin repeat protein